ncbi:MAG: radical SAM protein [Desulfovibrio sp.]|nr:radical SAM protein [Desulfovibrio sp.]
MTRTLVWHPFRPSSIILPFFLPFAGCPFRCLYCAQNLVTGANTPLEPLADRFLRLSNELNLRQRRGQAPPHLAFYGGTFTALPEADFTFCLEQASSFLDQGLISGWRCSTRPDALDERRLLSLQKAGLAIVELGIQSFAEAALAKTGRGYGQEVAIRACQKIRDWGFQLGVQLLPGMPGVSPKIFLNDVRRAITLSASFLRFYPCLVIAGTKLAKLWENGQFQPWDLSTTLATLAHAYLLAQDAGVCVIRMGLAPQTDLLQQLLAGPWHPALGARVMARALYLAVCRQAAGASVSALRLPSWLQGFFFGEKGEMRTFWGKLGLTSHKIHFGRYRHIELDLVQP